MTGGQNALRQKTPISIRSHCRAALLAVSSFRCLARPLRSPPALVRSAAAKPSDAQARFVYVGTYTSSGVPPGGTHPSTALGIYVFKMDPSDGGLTQLQIVPASNPSFVALDPTQTHLYSVNEDLAGRVSAYAINSANGTLSFLNMASANGAFTTHISVQPSGTVCLRRQLRQPQLQAASRFIGSSPTARSAP